MSYVSELENERQAGRYKSRIILGLFVLTLMMSVGWMNASNDVTVHYPPDLRSGATMKAGVIPPSEVYLFSQYILQQLNTWDVNGSKDYPNKVHMLRAYLTPNYQRQLEADVALREQQGELRERIRTFSFSPGSAYREDSVQPEGDAWIAWFDVRIKEFVLGKMVKDVELRYPIRVVRYDVDRENNPWQMALDGSGNYSPVKVSQLDTQSATTKGAM